MKCRKCGGSNFSTKPNAKNPNATDLYCTDCGAWQKFATKDEIRMVGETKKEKIVVNKYDSSFARELFKCGPTSNLKTDCKFYTEQRDMYAIVPCCEIHAGFGNCPCKGCKSYKSKYEPEKTADEMFAELGYEKVTPNSDEAARYSRKGTNERIEIFLCGDCSCKEGKTEIFFTKGEILACAQFIKEMGAEK